VAERYVRLNARTAEEAYLQAKSWAGAAGTALDAALLFGAGPAVVGALDELGPVIVLTPLTGSPVTVATAAERLARFGASWITVAANAGGEAMRAAVAAVTGAGCRVAVETLPGGLDDAAAAALVGSARGRHVSRLAAAAAAAGVDGVLCAWGDLGVVAQVAPQLTRILDSSGQVVRWSEAVARGAGVLVFADAAALGALGPADGSQAEPSERGRRRR
jgi:orotidine-5'-phosphate decarboxylase